MCLIICAVRYTYGLLSEDSHKSLEWFYDLQDMMNTVSSHHCNCSLGFQEHLIKGRFSKTPCPGYSGPYPPSRGLEKLVFTQGQCLARRYYQGVRKFRPAFSSMVDDGMDPDNSKDGNNDEESTKGETGGVCSHCLFFSFPPFLYNSLLWKWQ